MKKQKKLNIKVRDLDPLKERHGWESASCRVKDSRSSAWNWLQTFGKPSVICVMMGFWR
jgi:hypothetical protein